MGFGFLLSAFCFRVSALCFLLSGFGFQDPVAIKAAKHPNQPSAPPPCSAPWGASTLIGQRPENGVVRPTGLPRT
ncbi:hypothetical protein T484DRAFT_2934572, partial [Baffinella frigidus]